MVLVEDRAIASAQQVVLSMFVKEAYNINIEVLELTIRNGDRLDISLDVTLNFTSLTTCIILHNSLPKS